jgi:hypothetical protein
MYILFYYFDKYTYCLEKMYVHIPFVNEGMRILYKFFFKKKSMHAYLLGFYKGVSIHASDRNFWYSMLTYLYTLQASIYTYYVSGYMKILITKSLQM